VEKVVSSIYLEFEIWVFGDCTAFCGNEAFTGLANALARPDTG